MVHWFERRNQNYLGYAVCESYKYNPLRCLFLPRSSSHSRGSAQLTWGGIAASQLRKRQSESNSHLQGQGHLYIRRGRGRAIDSPLRRWCSELRDFWFWWRTRTRVCGRSGPTPSPPLGDLRVAVGSISLPLIVLKSKWWWPESGLMDHLLKPPGAHLIITLFRNLSPPVRTHLSSVITQNPIWNFDLKSVKRPRKDRRMHSPPQSLANKRTPRHTVIVMPKLVLHAPDPPPLPSFSF